MGIKPGLIKSNLISGRLYSLSYLRSFVPTSLENLTSLLFSLKKFAFLKFFFFFLIFIKFGANHLFVVSEF